MITRFDFIVSDANERERLVSKVMDIAECPLVAVSDVGHELTINETTALEIYDYFLNRAGYISYEFDTPTHKFINRLKVFIDGFQKDKVKETTKS